MPALRNERHERFAQEIAKGKNGADAYLAAGYALARAAASRNAYRLRNRQDVAARIDELSAKARGRIAAEQIAEGIRRGAPTLYRPELAELSRRLALLGATDQEMADALGIDQVTLDRWKTRHKEFGIATQHGKIKADAEIAESLYNRALGYTHEAMKIFMPVGAETPVYVPYVQHYPPDTTAAVMWLRNRQPDKWRNRHEVNVTGSIAHRLAQMTPEERGQYALDLAERVRRRLLDAGVIVEHDE